MISGTADDRLALVIETESKLDGIKAARSEVVGLKSDTQGLGVASVAATHEMSAWAAMQAEAAGHVGEHSLAIGRLEMSLARFAEHATGMNSTLGILSASLAKFAIGSIETAGILIGIDAIIAIYDKLTEAARKATDEQNKAIEAFEKMSREKALGPEGAVIDALNKQIAAAEEKLASPFSRGSVASQQANLDRLNRDLAQALAYRDAIMGKSAENTDKAFAGNIATLVAFNAHDQAARQTALALIRAYHVELGLLGDADVEKRAEIISKIKTLNATFEEEDKRAAALEKAALAKLMHLGAGINVAAVIEREQAKAVAAGTKGAAMHADLEAKALEMSLRTADQETKAKEAAAQADYMKRQVEIAAMDNTEKQKTQLLADAERLRTATIANIREAAADKVEKERQVAEAKLQAAEKRKEQIMLHSINSFVHASASLQKLLIEAALSPLIKELEGTAVRQFVRAAASFAAGDFAGAAQHAAAGALATAGAREVAQLGAMAGGGGSSSGGGYGGGGSAGSGSGTFTPQSATQGQGSVTIQLYSLNPYGAEQIQQLQFNLNRAGILKVPIPISPTNQIRAVA